MELESKEKQQNQTLNNNSNRGTISIKDDAIDFYRKQFNLSAKMLGRYGRFYQVRDIVTKGTDKHFEYEEPVDVAYHLEQAPSRKLLTRYGWFTENMEELPIILFLTYYDLNNNPIRIDEGAKLELSAKRSIQAGDIQTETFQITDLHTDFELNQCVCKIVPIREDLTENVSVIETKEDPNNENKYLNRAIYYVSDEEEYKEGSFISRN